MTEYRIGSDGRITGLTEEEERESEEKGSGDTSPLILDVSTYRGVGCKTLPSQLLEVAKKRGIQRHHLTGATRPSHWSVEEQAAWEAWIVKRPGYAERVEKHRAWIRQWWRDIGTPARSRRRRQQRYRAERERAARGKPKPYGEEYA